MCNEAKTNFWHLMFGMILATLAIASLHFGWSPYVSGVLVGAVNFYVIFILVEVAWRSQKDWTYDNNGVREPKKPVILRLPNRLPSLFQIVFVLNIVIFGFANMFLQLDCKVDVPCTDSVAECAIQKPAADSKCKSSKIQGMSECVTTKPDLRNGLDAVYFSTITLTTFGGNGEFVPANSNAKKLVLWEVFTGIALLLCAFPLVISRLSDF